MGNKKLLSTIVRPEELFNSIYSKDLANAGISLEYMQELHDIMSS